MRAAIYARVSTLDQEPENQLAELRRYVKARSWTGAKNRRPGHDQEPALLQDA